MQIDTTLKPADLKADIERLWERSAVTLRTLDRAYKPENGTPVFTVEGQYTARGWTEWTQGFQFGSALLQFDATGESEFLEMGRQRTLGLMAPHITHMGVHDHGFNNVSTYGTLWRLMNEGRIPESEWERHFYELALKCTGAVQARRWTRIENGQGYIYSFNGPHSLFADTIRSLRALAVSHRLGHVLMEEHDEKVSLLDRLIQHAQTTADHIVFYGEGRDAYDVSGRVAHEAIFNVNDGQFRCSSTQQGYAPVSTWTRGLSWVMCGYPEQLEFLDTVSDAEWGDAGDREAVRQMMLRAARVSCDFFIENTPVDGIPYWDTGAPGLAKMGDYLNRPSDPFNDHEPIDSSAAAIGAQGLLRLGRYLDAHGEDGSRYTQAGLTVLRTLLQEPYLNNDDNHQGLLLHTIYHQPRGWDHIPAGRKVPCGESCMWGDYHARELALYVQRLMDESTPYYTFFNDPRKEVTL